MKKILSLVLVLAMICAMAVTASAANVTVDVDKEIIGVGDTVTVTVSLDEAIPADVAATTIMIELTYDKAVLTYASSEKGAGYDFVTVTASKRNPVVSMNWFDVTSTGRELPAGTVATIVFTANEATTTAELELSTYMIAQTATGETVAENTVTTTITVCPNHNVVTETVAATCTEDGCVKESCEACGYSQVIETIAATGHTEAEAVKENEVAATCTTDGSYDEVVYCSVCNEVVSSKTVTVPATGHTPGEVVVENATDAACTNGGSYDEVVYCTACNEELSRETVTVEAEGHKYESEVTPGTCVAPSVTTYTCSVCGDSYSEEGEYGDHPNLVYTAEVPATCTTDGCGAYYYCDLCMMFFDESGMNTHPRMLWIPATGHSYEYTVVWAEDYSSATVVGTCSVCGDTVELEATVTSVETAVTCTTDGYITYTAEATVDGEVLTFTEKVITEKATGHVDEDEDDICDVCGGNAKTGDFTVIAAAAAAVISMTSIVALPVAQKKFF